MRTITLELGQLAQDIEAELVGGNAQEKITGMAVIDKAMPGQISFLSNAKYRSLLSSTQASAVIVSQEDVEVCPVPALVSNNIRLSLAKLAAIFMPKPVIESGVHSSAVIDPSAHIAPGVSIAAHVTIGPGVKIARDSVIGAGCVIQERCVIGAKTTLKPNVTLYPDVRVGDGCLIHSGAVIGADGFGYAHHGEGWTRMPHLGSVVIGDNVDIGANTTIDRGVLEDTCISDGVIIDNLVQIGHNVSIGQATAIAGCVAVAGSTKIGAHCLIGGGSSIAGHISITDKVQITGTTGVSRSLTSPGSYSSGMPAKPTQVWRRNIARFNTLDKMAKRIQNLETNQRENIED